ncbi:MAG: CNNM domain-containing protein [Bacteroidota bacterium]
MLFPILVISLSLVFSFLFSFIEVVLIAVTPDEVKQQVDPLLLERLQFIKERMYLPLSMIATMKTIVITISSMAIGHELGSILGNSFFMTILAPMVLTLLILILGEIIPKIWAYSNRKKLTPFSIITFDIIARILFPLGWILKRVYERNGRKPEKPIS